VLKPLLQRLGVIDLPNERSSHCAPVIRGVGLSPLLSYIAGFTILLLGNADRAQASILLLVLVVSVASGVLGWIEDYRGLPVALRAAMQLLIGLTGAGFAASIVGSSGWLVFVPMVGVGIAGYINVANFMDGINGISGVHGVVVGAIFAIIGIFTAADWLIPAGLIIAVAFLGFLPWNLLRGGIFLGDTGSYLLGGSIAIVAAAAITQGVPAIAMLGPLAVYLADSGVTLVRRILGGERWHEAHRSHVYQRLTDSGWTHVQVAALVAVASIGTGAFGLIVIFAPELWLLSTALILIAVCGYLMLGRARSRSLLKGPTE
jgi:UDP-N-acetylmuramyl pentapeptide phosphotransferase/UDP-N-acetylglucosamine-1-phosphate transferase